LAGEEETEKAARMEFAAFEELSAEVAEGQRRVDLPEG
jgi:hypothetical protein